MGEMGSPHMGKRACWDLFVSGTTYRKIQKESNTGSVDSQRVKLLVQIEVKTVDFDPQGAEIRQSLFDYDTPFLPYVAHPFSPYLRI